MLIHEKLTEKIITSAIEVHRYLGPGLMESAYEECLCYELTQHGLPFERQKELPVQYKNVTLKCGYRIDVVVDERVILELKCVETILPVHKAQILTYLKLTGKKLGYLLNFGDELMKYGISRILNGHVE